ncbi:MAG: efflux RND transporter periplasmic adaptor subunit [Alphaproteobacteria bacterium]|nr:efflux RND transporter periplasmic adaptor subunit [Alphaproteobacteria bacterium]
MSKKSFLSIAIGVGLAALLFVAYGQLFPAESDAPPVLTAQAVRKDLEESVLASGTLEASKLVSVGAQVSGQVKALKVKLGDKVQKDQLVAEIDSLTQQNNLHNAEASLENVRAQLWSGQAALKEAEAVFIRQKAMRSHDATSKEKFQAAEASYESAKATVAGLEAQIRSAEIAVDTAKVNLGYTNITAPIDGTVVAIVTEEGQTVNAAQQAPTIIKLAQLDLMTIKAQISEADITRVKIGQRVHFTILGEPDIIYEAKLRAIEPAPESIKTESSSGSSSSSASSSSSSAIYYNGLFDVPNDEGLLRISMTAEVNIVLAEARKAVSIPRTALGDPDPDGGYSIHVVGKDGRQELRKITVGINNNVDVEVLSGVQEGETVVVSISATKSGESSQTNFGRRPPSMGM